MRDFFFPRSCLHCKEPLTGKENFFCTPCQEHLQLLSPNGRCPRCFRPQLPCTHCRKKPTPWTRRAALFEATGPGKSLQFALHEPGVQKLLASLIILQLEKLQWPMPNEILCQPYTFLQRLAKGTDPDPELVKHLRKKLRPKRSPDPVILLITSDGREVDEDKLLRRFPKELLCLDITMLREDA